MTYALQARVRAICERYVSLQVVLLLCGCPQRLDDDFRLGANAGDAPGPLATQDVGDPDASSPNVTNPDVTSPEINSPDRNGADATIIGSIPADGALGVLPDTSLVLTFSSPMNRASVEAAYTSSDLPASAVSFAWSDADHVLSVQPNAPLQSSAGSSAAEVEALKYVVQIGASARDAAGNAFVSKRIAFSTARAIRQRLAAVTDRDLTGNWRSDGTYGVIDCERGDTTVCVGDSPTSANPTYRGFITFDLRQAPASAIEITAAELSCNIVLDYGAPFNGLGALHVDHIEFDTIGEAAFGMAALPERQSHTAPMEIGELLAVDALAAVRSDWPAHAYNQYRLSFESATDGDASVDLLGCDWSTLALALTYWLP